MTEMERNHHRRPLHPVGSILYIGGYTGVSVAENDIGQAYLRVKVVSIGTRSKFTVGEMISVYRSKLYPRPRSQEV